MNFVFLVNMEVKDQIEQMKAGEAAEAAALWYRGTLLW